VATKGRWRLITRHGSDVRQEEFDELREAIAAMQERAAEVVRAGPLEHAKGFRDYEPAEQVAARIALSTGGRLRGREAGVDIMGDGALVPYAGVVNKRRLEGGSPDRALEAVEEALR
jgi:hypothetical protein